MPIARQHLRETDPFEDYHPGCRVTS
jgi:hypothetical protein